MQALVSLLAGAAVLVAADGGPPGLAVGAAGEPILTWSEAVEGSGHAVRLAALAEEGWSAPVTVVEGDDVFASDVDVPVASVAPDGSWLVQWFQAAADGHGYHVALSRSSDRGRTWSREGIPYADRTAAEHGFAALAPWTGGRTALVWLDGRDAGGGLFGGGATALRFTTLGPGGETGPDVLVDDRVCDCCSTALARGGGGLLVAYRDRSDDEYRDVAVARYRDGRWGEPRLVSGRDWEMPGCPMNGPALAAAGEEVAVAWFTAGGQSPRVLVAFSRDGGGHFGRPVRIDEGSPLGRVSLVLADDGAAAVSWVESTEDGPELRVRRAHRAGGLEPSWAAVPAAGHRLVGTPRMVRAGDGLALAWFQTGNPTGLHALVVPLDGDARSGSRVESNDRTTPPAEGAPRAGARRVSR